MNANLKNELVEVFKGQIERSVRAQFAELVARFGESIKGVANSRQYSVWREIVSPCCEREGNRPGAKVIINDEYIARYANKLSDEMADEILAKVNTKAGELSDGKVNRVSGANFVITGKKGDRFVRIEQNQIINVSVKGKLFNQYPSRIYVDGKFTPANAFALI